MVEIKMISGDIFYFEGSIGLFGSYVRAANGRGGNVLEVFADSEKNENVTINLLNVESFVEQK